MIKRVREMQRGTKEERKETPRKRENRVAFDGGRWSLIFSDDKKMKSD